MLGLNIAVTRDFVTVHHGSIILVTRGVFTSGAKTGEKILDHVKTIASENKQLLYTNQLKRLQY
jgi:hypothetical protein